MIKRKHALMLLCATVPIAAFAQSKQSSYPTTPPPAAPQAAAPAPKPAVPDAGGKNPAALKAAEKLPLDPATKAIRDRVPPNPKAIERQLGLREPVGPKVNFEGRNPSKQEIVNALKK